MPSQQHRIACPVEEMVATIHAKILSQKRSATLSGQAAVLVCIGGSDAPCLIEQFESGVAPLCATDERARRMNAGFSDTVLVLNHDGLGQAGTALSHKLVVSYMRTLIELEQFPKAVVFYADGVKLVAEGTPCQKELAELSAAGVPLIACRTCLDFYALEDRVVVGEIGNMLRIVEAQMSAAKVITL